MVTWGRLTDLINNGRALTYNATLSFVFSKKDVQQFTIELNTGDPGISEHGQLFLQGIDSKGVKLSEIGGDYAPFTVDVKKATGLPFDRVTLYQEGDFYKTWEFVQTDKGFVLKANTIKEGEDLRDSWGDNIIGLTYESISELAKEIIPDIINYILSTLLS